MNPQIQGAWTVTSYRSGDVMVEPHVGGRAFLVVDGSAVGGSMGINRFAGQLGDDSSFGALAMTRMAGPPELMLQEDILLEHLQGADQVEVAGDGMFLRGDGLLLVELERSGTDEEPVTS